jgi:hypothetical protein
MRWTEHVAHIKEMKSAHKILVGNPEQKKPTRRPRCRRENNAK